MRILGSLLFCCFWIGCSGPQAKKSFTQVQINTLFEDSLSIRALEIMPNSLAFAANKGVFGSVDLNTGKVLQKTQTYGTGLPEFRAVAYTTTDFFMLSVGNPALLYKTGENGQMQLVYKEEGDAVFYDAMAFWTDREGIAVGDSMGGCLSIAITRDGGNTWQKTPCSELPESVLAEGAFAASNTNIKTLGDKAWIGTTAGRIYYSPDKGLSWQVVQTPIVNEGDAEGIYSIDFYDQNIGFAIGGDYTQPERNTANKAITVDGGKTWRLVANGIDPQYKSCAQFVPNSNGFGIVALGFTGISYSNDRGETWKGLSDEPFYTLRFLNDSVAYAAGKNRIAKLVFR